MELSDGRQLSLFSTFPLTIQEANEVKSMLIVVLFPMCWHLNDKNASWQRCLHRTSSTTGWLTDIRVAGGHQIDCKNNNNASNDDDSHLQRWRDGGQQQVIPTTVAMVVIMTVMMTPKSSTSKSLALIVSAGRRITVWQGKFKKMDKDSDVAVYQCLVYTVAATQRPLAAWSSPADCGPFELIFISLSAVTTVTFVGRQPYTRAFLSCGCEKLAKVALRGPRNFRLGEKGTQHLNSRVCRLLTSSYGRLSWTIWGAE